MNRTRRSCTLLLAAVLALEIALQPRIGGVFAEEMDQTEQIVAVCPECGSEEGTHTEECSLYVPEEPGCTCGGEDGAHAEDCPLYVPEEFGCTCGTEDGAHTEDCPLYVPEELACTCGTEDGAHTEDCPLYVPEELACTCGGEDGAHAEDCPLYVPEEPACTCGTEDGAHTEDCPLYVPAEPVCTCGTEDGTHTEDCPLYVPEEPACTCGAEDGVHTEDCPLYVPAPACTCGTEDGAHTEDCPLYVPIETVCPECGGENDVHTEDCSHYVPAVAVCPECGKADGHEETCSQYIAEPVEYPWAGLTEAEFVTWLMDEANAEMVKSILSGEDREEYAALHACIDAILNGRDEVLARQVWEYLAVLTGLDQPKVLPEGEKDEYVYFDLAAGNVTIGANSYSGKIYVNGEVKDVSATARTGDEKFYIYQSTAANQADTGYADQTAYENKEGCRVPEYDRVSTTVNGETKSWTEFITNNSDVYAVSRAWEEAAKNSGRTATNNHITFAEESDYTADVTVDNIWSSHHVGSTSRTTGGIGANLYNNIRNTHINLFLKGDSRVGCIHYSAKRNCDNTLSFSNGDGDSAPGSITVADFPTNWKANHWNSVIGAADNPANVGDVSDGIVINSGVIYAGATAEDNCTAIGGGGNNYGGVTINGGTVTAVTAGTGTAIGGGIGYGSQGGDTDVIITGGKIYAYNLGVQKGVGDNFGGFVPSAAIGGGGSQNAAGNLKASITINGGFVYAQSMGGPAIGGGSSANSNGGNATVTINGGTIIAKSVRGTYGDQNISASVGIGGGTGKTAGGSVTLKITEEEDETILRTGSIGGGLATNGSRVGSANVTITGGDIAGQVVMAGGTGTHCTFDMSGGTIHGPNVIDGNQISSVDDPNPKTKILYLYKNGGAVWMQDPNGKAEISGGTIKDCTANLGGAIYMEGGTFTMTGGTISNNTAKAITKDDGSIETGRGGAINMAGGTAYIQGGTIEGCTADLGGAVYMASREGETHGGTFTMTAGTIRNNKAESTVGTGRGGGINMIGGEVTITGGTIEGCTADLGGGVYMAHPSAGSTQGGLFTMSGGEISGNTANGTTEEETGRGGGVCVYGGDVHLNEGSISGNTALTRGGGLYVTDGDVHVEGGSISGNTAVWRGGGVFVEDGHFTMNGGEIVENRSEYRGGGLFLTKSPALNGGVIANNSAKACGGGLCVKGDSVTLTDPAMQIFGNTAERGGGVAVLNGAFLLNGGNVGVMGAEPNKATYGGGLYVAYDDGTVVGTVSRPEVKVTSGSIWNNEALQDGGGVYLSGGDVNVLGTASISHNKAIANGGGVYLEAGDGEFRLDGETANISHNTANRGGGAYLHKDPALELGTIAQNTATLNGGGLYISDCEVTLNAEKDVSITENRAENGAGIFINRSDNSTNTTGLRVDADMPGTVSFTNNTATKDGGAVCVNNGYFDMESDRVTIAGNSAENGGGVALHRGDFTMTAGSIGQKNGGNTAVNGGGVYVDHGKIRMKGGVVQYNEATNGGGAYVTGGLGDDGGWLIMGGGSFTNNTASENGGGGYAAGDFHMMTGTIGGNSAKNGGGIYVEEGNATIVNGTISHNRVTEDGGGICISASTATEPITMVMLSGSLSNNQADRNGGGLAVEGTSSQQITVEIGCLLDHHLDDADNKPTLPIDYTGAYKEYEEYDLYPGMTNRHENCPKVEYNQAGEIGGAFYLNSAGSTLSFFCVEESNNTTLGLSAADTEVVGGKIIIGDHVYHNREYDGLRPADERHGAPWGYVSMEDAAKVNGGQVDLYGNMINPIFKEDITVNIQDTDKDHFIDHRLAEEDAARYKIHYFENFDNGGLYRAFQYNENVKEVTVQSALFSRPGYTILGWSTKPDSTDEDAYNYLVGDTIDFSQDVPGMGDYTTTNCEFCKEHTDGKLLVLYAIWKTNGYTVVFDPNVSSGDSYTGDMKNKTLTYEKKESLPKNAYKYPGHFFTGWNTKVDGKGTAYEDEGEVLNLTDKDGATVTLYAQWKKCDHKTMGERTYTAKGETLTRTCSCGGQTLTATLSAEDTVYDGKTHPATLTFNKESDWGDDKPTIEYTGKRLSDADKTAYGETLNFDADGKPFHAGKYTATITKQNDGTDVTVSVNYTIEKAEQSPPEKPTYTVSADEKTVKINKLEDNKLTDKAGKTQMAAAEYCLTYAGASIKWEKMPAGADTLDIPLNTALTNYTVQARYAELEDYKPSEVKKADAVYFFAGDVEVRIVCDDGINCEDVEADGDNSKTDGITLQLKTDEANYYLVSGEYEVQAKAEWKDPAVSGSGAPKTPAVELKDGTTAEYSVTNIENNTILTITIGKARKKPTSTGKVTSGQVFSAFTSGTTTEISRDSAFTAAFQIEDYDPAVYACPKLTFVAAVPANTTVILLERGESGEKTYWYYRAAGEVGSVPLTQFQKMGGSGSYSMPTPAEGDDGYIDLSYQFIVDFSQTSAGYSGAGPLAVTLEAAAKDAAASNAPAVKAEVSVTMKESAFAFAETSKNGLTNSFTCKFGKGAAASKWENRASALVLTPKDGTVLPPDARVKAVVNGGTIYLYRSGESFIVPLSLLEAGEKAVSLTLESALFPAAKETEYSFDVQWLVSPSKAGRAPMNGDEKVSELTVTFTSSEKKTPSLKITGQDRLLESGQDLKLTVQTKNMEGYTVSATLLHKWDGAYSGTGWRDDEIALNGNSSLTESFGEQTPGSYCLMLTVKQEGSITTVMEVPYYFVIKSAQ